MDTSASFALKVREDLQKILDEYFPADLRYALGIAQTEMLDIHARVFSSVLEDAKAFAQKDSAAHSDHQVVYKRTNFQAVRNYRLAHHLYSYSPIDSNALPHLQAIAIDITERTKAETHIEIHPGATIGMRFILDHGTATVIGEQCVIGDDCYILHDVTLGAAKTGRQVSGRRHPKIGNSVMIGPGVRVYGPITVGDNVHIMGDAIITSNIPPDTKVRVEIIYQIVGTDNESPHIIITGIHRDGMNRSLILRGLNFPTFTRLELLSPNLELLAESAVNECDSISAKIHLDIVMNAPQQRIAYLRLLSDDTTFVLLHNKGVIQELITATNV